MFQMFQREDESLKKFDFYCQLDCVSLKIKLLLNKWMNKWLNCCQYFMDYLWNYLWTIVKCKNIYKNDKMFILLKMSVFFQKNVCILLENLKTLDIRRIRYWFM